MRSTDMEHGTNTDAAGASREAPEASAKVGVQGEPRDASGPGASGDARDAGVSGEPDGASATGGAGDAGDAGEPGGARAAGSAGDAPGAVEAPAYVPGERPRPPDDGLSAVQRDALAGIAEHTGLMGDVIDVLREVYDPEIPVNVYDLGLVYDAREVEPGRVYVLMTLTSPMCPVAESLPPEVKRRVEMVPGVGEALVDITWEPPWTPDKMAESARLQLNFFY